MAATARGVGAILLGVWLVLHGLISIVDLHFNGLGLVMGILALVAGILILIGK